MKTVIEMAREAGVAFDSEEYPDIWMTYMNVGRKEIERFAELVRADEREACAKVAAGYGPSRPIVSKTPSSQIIGRWEGEQAASVGIEAAIRARGGNK